MIAEKIELLGKGLYTDIPDQLTLKAIPTVSELDYVGSEDFEAMMTDFCLLLKPSNCVTTHGPLVSCCNCWPFVLNRYKWL